MRCPECGTELNSTNETCPECQKKMNSSEKLAITRQQQPKRHMPRWFKLAIFVALLALVAVSGGLLFTESLVNVAEKQLSALRSNEIEAAYREFTSSQFKENTSLEEFRNFVNSHPILMTHQSALFPQRSIVDHITILKGKLLAGDQSSTSIEYRLIKEDGKWKVLSVSLLKEKRLSKADKRKMLQITKLLLENIQTDNSEIGYERYFSNKFKANTSLENFNELIKKHIILFKDYEPSFHSPHIKEGVGSLSVVLKADNDVLYLKTYYIQEEDSWKISNVHLLSP